MDVQEALAFVDQVLHAKTGKHLSDIERQVFVGSWQGKTYQEIYPVNPEYIEKTLAYRLWRKLSEAFGDKVSKKQIKGLVERAWQNQRHVFISYRGYSPAPEIATNLSSDLQKLGYATFVHDLDRVAFPPDVATSYSPAVEALHRCDCFILLLSAQVVLSEMVLEQLRSLRQSSHHRTPPQLVVIALPGGHRQQLSHDLRNFLSGAYYWAWEPAAPQPASLSRLRAILEQDMAAIAKLSLSRLAEEAPELIGTESGKLAAEVAVYPETALAPNRANSLGHPLPGADPEIPQGQVRPESRFYIERQPYEAKCYDEITRPGALIRIKAPRQMGKTSLMARILTQAQENGYRAIPVTFQHADRATFEDLGSLLRWFCGKVARKLRLPHRLDDYWETTFGSKDNCTSYFEEYLLPEIEHPLVLGLDEVDEVFRYPAIADDFFGLLRAWYEEASYGSGDSELWKRLRLVVVHSTEVYLPLDVNQSPFNVGLPVELSEFTRAQVSDLVGRYDLSLSPQDIDSLMALVGGHPYLMRLALYHLTLDQITLADLWVTGPTEAGIYGDHLRRHLATLEQNPDLARAYRSILDAPTPLPLSSEHIFKLHSLGLVHLKGNGAVPSFELYRRYFSDRLQLPA